MEGDRIIGRGDPGYPDRLERLPDPPDRIHVRGAVPEGPMVAIVGAREADPQMRRLAFNLAGDLAARGMIVISGGALGIDTAAHLGCLESGGPTLAVLGSGLDQLYPTANRELFARIAGSGALLSELEPGMPPTRWTFPRRNRIVAAMARAVVVVQASLRSGALITAGEASKLGVPVGAVPCAPADPRGRGCNRLLKEGAAVVEDAVDIVKMVNLRCRSPQLDLPTIDWRGKESPSKAPAGLSGEESRVLGRLGASPTHIDEILSGSGLTAAQAATVLLSLELAGLVQDVGGKNFVRVS